MPKIRKQLREDIMQEAQKQLLSNGYAATTIRSVAEACQIGVGTVYNYFPSKDALIAAFMLEDWRAEFEPFYEEETLDAKQRVREIYEALQQYVQKYGALFLDRDARKVFAIVSWDKHLLLRKDLAATLLPLCQRSALDNKTFLAEFLAESLLTWGIEGKAFEDVFAIIQPLLSSVIVIQKKTKS